MLLVGVYPGAISLESSLTLSPRVEHHVPFTPAVLLLDIYPRET